MPTFARRTAFALSLCLLFASAYAATYVEVGKAPARMALLKPGTHHYLRYMADGESNAPIDIWTRTVSFEARGLHIKQRWDGALAGPGKPGSLKLLDSWFDASNFRPLSHERISEKEGKRIVEGFLFAPDKISGMPDLADNTQKALAVATPESTFNFETDIELLQTLPLAAGYEAELNFYHGGGPAPARYTFKVSGSATIAGPSGPVDCWVVTTDYNRPGTISTFWFAKGSQLMVRQESPLGPGKTFVKTLID